MKIHAGFFALAGMSLGLFADDSLVANGHLRLGYQYNDNYTRSGDETALGVQLHAEKTITDHITAGVTLDGVMGNGEPDAEGIPFFDENNKAYAGITEGWLRFGIGRGNSEGAGMTVKLGRQVIDTPFADSDDIGMVPNSFDALWMTGKPGEDLDLSLGWLYRWGGVDAPAQRSHSKINGDKGVAVAGASLQATPQISLSGWIYHAPGMVTASYLEAGWGIDLSDAHYGVELQGVYQANSGSEDARVLGVRTYYGHKASGLTGTLALNKTFGAPADNLWGGGPFFTNVEHNTLTQAGTDGSVAVLTIGWDGAAAGIDGLSLGTSIDRHLNHGNRTAEFDLTASYAWSDTLELSAVYSDVKTPERFKNLRIFAEYRF